MNAVTTVDDVAAIVKAIAKVAGDNERAHSMEDDLYEAVLTAIALGLVDEATGRDMAMAALKTKALDFTRWCA